MLDEKIFIVILTWNNYHDTKECIDSLLQPEIFDFELLLVDNASTDGSIEKIIEEYPNINTLLLKENTGISGGYNAGLRYALDNNAKYIVLSNNDIVFFNNTISLLIDAAKSNKDVGIIVPKTLNYYDHNKLAGIGGKWRHFPPSVKMIGVNTPDREKFQQNFQLEYAISACYLVTDDLINKIGYYDTGYFFYNDDWDFSIRARKAGFKILLIHEAKILHKVSISTQKSEKKDIWWNYFGRSTVRFYQKHRNSFELILYIIWFILRESLKLNFNRITPFLKGAKMEYQQK